VKRFTDTLPDPLQKILLKGDFQMDVCASVYTS
jgi:hypothetical protein